MPDFLRPATPKEPGPTPCEGCGKAVTHAEAIAITVSMSRPGKDDDGTPIGAFGCRASPHLACCAEHAKAVAIRCMDEHLLKPLADIKAHVISGPS